jgi:hypothetical protein
MTHGPGRRDRNRLSIHQIYRNERGPRTEGNVLARIHGKVNSPPAMTGGPTD